MRSKSKWGAALTLMAAMSIASFEACSSDGGADDAGLDVAQKTDATNDAGALDAKADVAADSMPDVIVDAGIDAPPCTSTCGTANCGVCPASATVSLFNAYNNVTYKIDEHEVTNAEYAAFLSANVAPSTQPSMCSGNASFVPASGWPNDAGANPVANVGWCDAYAYCAWAKERLCGLISDGGNVASAYQDNGDQSEWFNACTTHHGGTGPGGWQTYPYANAYDASACNGADYGADATIPVKQAAGCVAQTADGGIFDLSGNVAEWENSCVEQDGGPGACALRGGGFSDNAGNIECATATNTPRTQAAPTTGIRCCSN